MLSSLALLGGAGQFWLSRAETAACPLSGFWVLLRLGEPPVLPRAASAQPFPSPHPQLRLPISRFGQKSFFPLPGNARPVAGGLQAGKGLLRVLRRSQPGPHGHTVLAAGPGRLVRDRAGRGAGRARGCGGRQTGSGGCRSIGLPRHRAPALYCKHLSSVAACLP